MRFQKNLLNEPSEVIFLSNCFFLRWVFLGFSSVYWLFRYLHSICDWIRLLTLCSCDSNLYRQNKLKIRIQTEWLGRDLGWQLRSPRQVVDWVDLILPSPISDDMALVKIVSFSALGRFIHNDESISDSFSKCNVERRSRSRIHDENFISLWLGSLRRETKQKFIVMGSSGDQSWSGLREACLCNCPKKGRVNRRWEK